MTFRMIFIAESSPVLEWRATLTRPGRESQTVRSYCRDKYLPEAPVPIVLPIFHNPILFGSPKVSLRRRRGKPTSVMVVGGG